ncbi:MAG: hypothetical protein EA380_10115, partial [Phycisphaeraceae bacterium]
MRPRPLLTTLLIAALALGACSRSTDDPEPATSDDAAATAVPDTTPEIYTSPHDLTVTLADEPLRT